MLPRALILCSLLAGALPALGQHPWGGRVESGKRATPPPKRIATAAAPAPIGLNAEASDPEGDTFGAGPDIVSLETQFTQDELRLVVTFSDPITAPPDPDGVHGYYEFDLDQSSATGAEGFPAFFCGYDTGTEVSIPLFGGEIDQANSTVNLYDENGDLIGEAGFEVAGRTLTFMIPLDLIGGNPGAVTASVVAGTDTEPTDCAIVAGLPATVGAEIPTLDPRGLALLAIALGLVATLVMRR